VTSVASLFFGCRRCGRVIVGHVCRQANHRAAAAGLGMPGSQYGAMVGDTYKECVKKTCFARFNEMQSDDK